MGERTPQQAVCGLVCRALTMPGILIIVFIASLLYGIIK